MRGVLTLVVLLIGVAVAPAPAQEDAPASPPEPRLRFNFSDAPFAMVLDFFARQTGLPVIREAEVPAGTLTFIGASDYSVAEAIEIFNLNLRLHGLRLVREDKFLYLRTLADAATRPTPVIDADGLDGVDPGEYVTMYLPLSNALASSVVEQIRPLVKAPGLVQAIDAQNLVLLVETGAQAKRIAELISRIDEVRPTDLAFRVFPVRFGDPNKIAQTLTQLIPAYEQKIAFDKNNNPRPYDDVTKPAMKFSADPRIGAVVAVGPTARMPAVQELLAVLDVADGAAAEGADDTPAVRALPVRTLRPEDAARRLESLFRALPELRRPRIQAIPEAGKVLVVGSPEHVSQAEALLRQLDPAGEAAGQGETVRVLQVEHAEPNSLDASIRRLLSPRAQQMLRSAPTPTGKGLVLVGAAGDVETYASLAGALDAAPDQERTARLVKLEGATTAGAIARALELDRMGDAAERDPVEVTTDDERGVAVVVGTDAGVARFEARLREIVRTTGDVRRAGVYTSSHVEPSALAERVRAASRAFLADGEHTDRAQPEYLPVDDLDQLTIRAEPEQLAVLLELAARLDVPRAGEVGLRVFDAAGADPQSLIARARELFSARGGGLLDPVEVSHDPVSGKLIASGDRDALRLFEESLRQAQELSPPTRTTRVVDLVHADATELIEALRGLLAKADPIDPSRAVPEPELSVLERTNSLMVTAEPAQHELIVMLVQRLDTIEPADLPPLRLLQLKTADAAAIARMLSEQYARRPNADRSARPVEVRADASTNTLIVSAHEELFSEIKGFVEELNKEREDGPDRVTVLYALKVAKAEDVARAMDTLYPEPPIPLDRRGRPMPWLREPKEVTVSADPSSNSLIIDAPAERIESLEELAARLDRVELPPVAELRTFRVDKADVNAVASMLRGLAGRGTLSGPAQPGKQQVQVVIEPEPRSNTLIVAGDDVTFAKVEQVLASLTAVPVERGLRIVPIANAPAGDVRDRAMTIYQAQIAGLPDAGGVDATIDDASNSIEVVADAEAMDRFMKILDELQSQIGPPRQVELVELRLADAGEVVGTLRELVSASETLRSIGGPTPSFEPVAGSNSILVLAQPTHMDIIMGLVAELDRQETADRPPLRILRLRSTDASSLASVLQKSFDRRPADERAKAPVDIQSDAATNTLIVSAHDSVMGEIEAIVRDLNESQALDAEGRVIRIFPLRIARAEALAETIDSMYPQPPVPRDNRGRPRPDLQPAREIVVRADPATNSLIVDAPSARMPGFERIVESLDAEAQGGTSELRTYKLRRAEPQAVANTLRDLASSGALGTPPQARVTVNANTDSRSVIVSAPPAAFERIEAVIDELEGEDTPTRGMRMFALEHARAGVLRSVLEPLLRDRVQDDPELAPLGDGAIEVTTDDASNTLIVSAPESLLEVAELLVESLDVERSASVRTVVRVVAVQHAGAEDIRRTIAEVLPTLELVAPDLARVSASADSNAVVVTGVAKDVERLARLIAELDVAPPSAERPRVEVIELTNARATDVAPRVRAMLEAARSDPMADIPWWARTSVAADRQRRGLATTAPPLSVEADARTNAVLVTATEPLLEVARGLVAQLDAPSEQGETVSMAYKVRKADAETLASFVERIASQTAGPESGEISLVPEPRTGTIVVVGTVEQVGRTMRDLSTFDEATPEPPPAALATHVFEHADARTAVAALARLLTDRASWPDVLRRAVRGGMEITTPTVSVDERRNAVVMNVPEPLVDRAKELARSLDLPEGNATIETRLFVLESGDAESIAKTLSTQLAAARTPAEPEPVVTAEARSNTVVISATPALIERADALVAAMDQVAVEPDGLGVRTIYLAFARAEALAPIVEATLNRDDFITTVPQWQRWQILRERTRMGDAPEPGVRVSAEPRLNALVVSGPRPSLALADDIVRQLDVEPTTRAPGRELRVVTLASASAQGVAAAITDVFDEPDTGERPPTVSIDTASNSLIVRGSPVQVAAIEALARRLDRATIETGSRLRTIPIDRSKADASAIAETIRRLLEQTGAVRVEVISPDELLRDEPADDDAGEPETGASIEPWRVLGGHGYAASGQPARAEESDPDADRPVVRIVVDPETNSLVVEGSDRMAARIAELARTLEDELPAQTVAVRLIQLPGGVPANAVAQLVRQTVREVGVRTDKNPGGFTANVAVAPDPQGNALVVWANDTDFGTVRRLIAGIARLNQDQKLTVKIYPLTNVNAREAASTLGRMLRPNGRSSGPLRVEITGPDGEPATVTFDPQSVTFTPDPSQTAVIVTAPAEAMPAVNSFVSQLDRNPVEDRLAIRRYPLQFAQADELVSMFARLFDARRQGPRANDRPRARFVADERTNALLVTASEDQHDEVASLLVEADQELEGDGLELAIIPLQLASPQTVAGIVREIVIGRDAAKRASIRLSAQEASGVLVVRAMPDDLATIRQIVEQVDTTQAGAFPVRSIQLERADAQAVASALQQFFRDRARVQRESGQRARGGDAAIVGDRRSGTIVIAASDKDYEQIASLVAQFDAPAEARELRFKIIPLEHIRASDISRTVQNIAWDLRWERSGWFRGDQSGGDTGDKLLVEVNERTNSVVLFGQGDTFDTIEEIIHELDAPASELGDTILRAVLAPGIDLNATAQILEELTSTPGWRTWYGRDPEAVSVRVDRTRNLLLLVGKRPRVEEAMSYLGEIIEGGRADERVEAVQLDVAQAAEVARTLQSALPETVRVRITPVGRTNSLLLTGSPDAIEQVKTRIAELDREPERAPLEFRRFVLEHADAADVAVTLRTLVRNRPRQAGEPSPSIDFLPADNTVAVTATVDEMAFISSMIEQFDAADSTDRRTEFVRLEYAAAAQTADALKVFFGPYAREAKTRAERDVSIVPDPASNSLVISAGESVWDRMRALLETLDTEDYDTSQQLVVIPLEHASAVSVARALNEGFRAPFDDQLERERVRLEAERRRSDSRGFGFSEPAVLVESEGAPVVSAEPQTNSLIVFAGRRDLERIRSLVAQLDVPDFLRLPDARVIPLTRGRASEIAATVSRAVVDDATREGSPQRALVFGDDTANAVIVRAEDEAFRRIETLVRALEARAEAAAPTPRVVRLRTARAETTREMLLRTFRPIVQQRGEQFTVEADRANNALVIGASEAVYRQVLDVLESLDPEPAAPDTAPGAQRGAGEPHASPGGAATLIVDIVHNDPALIAGLLNQMGVTRAAPAGGVGIVLEPVTVVPLTGSRRAVSLSGAPADVERVEALIAQLDVEPVASTQSVQILRLRQAQASRLAETLRAMLRPAPQDADTGPARSLAEQIRRLRAVAGTPEMELDLTVPVRLLADDASNTLIVLSTERNGRAIAALAEMLDTLPHGDAVAVRLFPLENASADRVRAIVLDLFNRGEALRRVPGTNRQGQPESAVGQALAGEVAVSVDARTNTLVVAAREQAVALIEVLIRDLDAPGRDRGWVETALVPLEYADAARLAETLRDVLIEGFGDTPEAAGLRRQVGRLRVLGEGGDPSAARESDLFVPLSDLVIRAEEDLNALLVVGTPSNIAVVRALAGQLDVEQADPSGEVRVIPLEHADATRVADVIEEVFRDRARVRDLRPEDEVSVSVDARTNALIVSTSPRSFEVLESLIGTLDAEDASFAVGLHVIPVPNADVDRLAPKIDRLMRDRLAAQRQTGRSAADAVFSVEPDAAAGVLIVAASEENARLVRELVDSLTAGEGGGVLADQNAMIPLESVGRAAEIAEAVRTLYVDRERRRRGDDALQVVASDTLNALIVSGTQADVEAIRELARTLDKPEAGFVEDVRRIPLDSASAEDIVDLLEDVLAGRSIAGGRLGGRATRVRVHVDELAGAEATIDGAIRDHVTLTPDVRTNSVLVKAPPEIMSLIIAIIEDLDSETRGDRVIERFRLVNADAVQMQELLVQLFSLTQRGNSYVLLPVDADGTDEPRGTEMMPHTFTAVPDQQSELTVTVDRRTNTLLVSGSAELIEEVSRIVADLDSIEATNRTRVVYELRNALAAEVQETLMDFFRGEADLRSATLGPQVSGSLIRQLEEEVTIVGDSASNKLVISASPRYIDTVTDIVRELDAPPPQVMIQVLLAEVTLDAGSEFGIDIALGGVIAVTDSNGLPNQAAGSPFGGDGYVFDSLAAGAGVATALGVPNLAIASGDFGLLIRALQAQGKLEVLSRPQVQVANNQLAEINVGENIAITDGVERRDNSTTAIVRRENVGILLSVTPSISPDGFVRLDIAPEISQLSPRTTQIDEGFEAPIITQRRVQTTVTVRDGQSVVIGGLIQTNNSVRQTKVPGLGDLPLIGGLFRTKEESRVKTELLVILTPYVIPGDATGAVRAMDELTDKALKELTDPSGVRKLLEGNGFGTDVNAPSEFDDWEDTDTP